MKLGKKIEAVLFYRAAPIKKTALCKLFEVNSEALESSLLELENKLSGGGTVLITNDTEVGLGTAPEADEIIENIRKDDLKRDIGKAGAETLAIVVYRGPITRAEVDRIRGVNSSYIIRNLQVRGLVERTSDKQIKFQITTELLRHLGISNKTELTDFEKIMNALENYERQQQTETV